MRWLYLMRHGIAVPHGTPGIAEDERPLTPEGEKRARQVAYGLRRLDVKVDRVVTSPLPRARRTAEIAAEVLGVLVDLEVAVVLKAGSDAETIRAWLDTRDEEKLMIVGHDPAFSDLVGLLATGGAARGIGELRKGGVAAFARLPDGRLVLDWLARPRILRRLR
jgi:phosphohistidine phosphatase